LLFVSSSGSISSNFLIFRWLELTVDSVYAFLKFSKIYFLSWVKSFSSIISPVAWVNINLTGRYQFKSYAGDIGFNDSVSKLKEYFYNEILHQTPPYHA
jgi:hypothetical protein